MTWAPAQLKKLKEIYDKKPKSLTNFELAGRLSRQFRKSPEAIRWQLRQFDKSVKGVMYPKILLLDIETLPIEIRMQVWNTQDVYVRPEHIEKDWSMLCWSAKWLFDDKKYGQVVTPQEAIAHDDKSILQGIWDLVNEAHVVIAHNGNNFDLKRLNTRWLLAGMPPPMYYKSIDTYQVIRSNFAFTYGKLNYVNAVLGIGQKVETSFKWWDECGKGNKKYLKMMLDYNIKDVDILEELYLRIRNWIPNHPNLGVYTGSDIASCPCCGDADLSWEGTYSTQLGLYQAFRCQHCGSIGRSTKKEYKLAAGKVQ